MVDNLNNNGELAGVGTAADEDHTANLNQLPLSNLHVDIGHGEGLPITHTKSLSGCSETADTAKQRNERGKRKNLCSLRIAEKNSRSTNSKGGRVKGVVEESGLSKSSGTHKFARCDYRNREFRCHGPEPTEPRLLATHSAVFGAAVRPRAGGRLGVG